jgi:quercetin dioxygenase-like cupin family protein
MEDDVGEALSSGIRRVVIGHSGQRTAVVVSDGPAQVVSRREHASSTNIWAALVPAAVPAQGMPIDGAELHASGAPSGGVRFMIMDLEPGCVGKMHRTDTLDFVVCLEGEIEMIMPGSRVKLRAGDTLVQQSTEHAWSNPGEQRARLAITLVDAVPLGPEFPAPRMKS